MLILILPADVQNSINHVLLRIREPKTRYRAARHQAGKVEQPDLMEIIRIGFARLQKSEKLWPWSGATLRGRFAKVLAKLHLPSTSTQVPKALTLASFRPGGATWLIGCTESAELVRRRGRWISFKIMECYLQEVTSTTYFHEISDEARSKVLAAMKAFPSLFKAAIHFEKCMIPPSSWFFLMQQKSSDRNVWNG